jgi:RNA-directed DNA polymerase
MDKLIDWSTFFDNHNVSEQQKSLLLTYIERLLQHNVPIIFEYHHLAGLLGFEVEELSKLTINTSRSYRTFEIPKRRGGSRTITSPYPALGHCQKWIYDNILKTIDLGDDAYAFRPDRSIKDNALVHKGSDELLKLDITDFFGSIKLERVIAIFQNLGYTNSLSFHLASICCYQKTLPQGACTSPSISNIIAKRLDRRLSGLAKKLNLKYSRYADDITFSGGIVPKQLSLFVAKILKSESFSVNADKTIFKTKGQKKIVTGLLVAEDSVRVTKKYRREFRRDVYYLLKNGLDEFNGVQGKLDPLYIDRMIGRANFIISIENTNSFAVNSLAKLIKLKRATMNSETSDDGTS